MLNYHKGDLSIEAMKKEIERLQRINHKPEILPDYSSKVHNTPRSATHVYIDKKTGKKFAGTRQAASFYKCSPSMIHKIALGLIKVQKRYSHIKFKKEPIKDHPEILKELRETPFKDGGRGLVV